MFNTKEKELTKEQKLEILKASKREYSREYMRNKLKDVGSYKRGPYKTKYTDTEYIQKV